MIIFLYGEDTFRSRQQLKKMAAKFKTERDPQGLNAITLDCEKENAGKIREQISQIPFLAEKRLIILENLLTGKQTELQEELAEKIKNKKLPESSILIIWEKTSNFKNKTAQALFSVL